MAPAIRGSRPYSALTIEAAFFSTPKALIRGGGSRSVGPPISKFCIELQRCQGQKGCWKLSDHTVVSVHPNNDPKAHGALQRYLVPCGKIVQTAKHHLKYWKGSRNPCLP